MSGLVNLASCTANLDTNILLLLLLLHYTGILGFIQEVLSNHIAHVPVYTPKDAPAPKRALAAAKIDLRALKIAAYGFLISAPMGHILVGTLEKFFVGKTSRGAKIGQLLANNLIIAPIQTFGTCLAL